MNTIEEMNFESYDEIRNLFKQQIELPKENEISDLGRDLLEDCD